MKIGQFGPLLMLLFPPAVVAQASSYSPRVSFGFVGGTPLTRDFPLSRTTFTDPNFGPGQTTFDWFSDTRVFLEGLSVEIDLGGGLSIEANALHRTLHLQRRLILQSGTVQPDGENTPTTWEWPILAKYGVPLGETIRPFVEVGPSFRTRHNQAPAEPSQIGATVGTGVEFRFGRFRVSPALRYTRWRYDGDYPRAATKRDQIEFVTGVSYATSVGSWRLANRKLRLGAVGGIPFTGGLKERDPFKRLNEQQGYLGGIAVEWELSRRASFEVNGLYRPLRARTYSLEIPAGAPADESGTDFTVVTWQFPALAKYRLCPGSKIRPVIEAGPSFRAAGNLNGYNPSRYGFTAGGGIETDNKAMKISPVLRYTRWAKDPAGTLTSASTARNQLELLFSFTF